MKKTYLGIPLSEFCEDKKQVHVAQLMGITPGALSMMLSSDREIYIIASGRNLKYCEIVRREGVLNWRKLYRKLSNKG